MASDARQLVIIGASGFAREIATWVESATGQAAGTELVGFVDELEPGRTLRGRPVLALDQAAGLGAAFVVAVGDPGLRERLAERAVAVGLRPAPALIHPSARLDAETVTIGDGTVICAGTTLTTDIDVGRHAQINLHCTVGHDVTLGDFATLAPGVHVSGKVSVGRGAYLGTGAVTVDGDYGRPLQVGDRAVVGAGSVVTRDVPAGAVAVGVPARPR